MEIEKDDTEEIIKLKRLNDELKERRLRLINGHDTNLLLLQMVTLGDMIVKLAKMIEAQRPDLDIAIEQANQAVKTLQESKL